MLHLRLFSSMHHSRTSGETEHRLQHQDVWDKLVTSMKRKKKTSMNYIMISYIMISYDRYQLLVFIFFIKSHTLKTWVIITVMYSTQAVVKTKLIKIQVWTQTSWIAYITLLISLMSFNLYPTVQIYDISHFSLQMVHMLPKMILEISLFLSFASTNIFKISSVSEWNSNLWMSFSL